MQVYFDVATDVAEIDAGLKDQQTDAESDGEPVVTANDNGLRWPLICFPEGWYGSC
jgi:hypothetical protein